MFSSVQSDCHAVHLGGGTWSSTQSSQLTDKQQLVSHTFNETGIKAFLVRNIALRVENCYHDLPIDFQMAQRLQTEPPLLSIERIDPNDDSCVSKHLLPNSCGLRTILEIKLWILNKRSNKIRYS